MPGPPTPILNLFLPTVGGDANTWGAFVNANFLVLDLLGSVSSIPVSSAYIATIPVFPETLLRVTTGGLTIPVTLPNPASATGKIFTVKKLDAGTGIVNITVAGGGTIDNQTTWSLTNQYAFVRLMSNGGSYDVIGSG